MFLNLSHDVKTALSLFFRTIEKNEFSSTFFWSNRRHLSQHDVKVDNTNYAEKVKTTLSLDVDGDNLSELHPRVEKSLE